MLIPNPPLIHDPAILVRPKDQTDTHPDMYEVIRASFWTVSRDEFPHAGCGAAALCRLTGEMPVDTNGIGISRETYPPEFMVNFLRKRGFMVMELNVEHLMGNSRLEYRAALVTRKHVMLAQAKMNRAEWSWIIIHENEIIHGLGRNTKAEFYTEQNTPLGRRFLVKAPHWVCTHKVMWVPANITTDDLVMLSDMKSKGITSLIPDKEEIIRRLCEERGIDRFPSDHAIPDIPVAHPEEEAVST